MDVFLPAGIKKAHLLPRCETFPGPFQQLTGRPDGWRWRLIIIQLPADAHGHHQLAQRNPSGVQIIQSLLKDRESFTQAVRQVPGIISPGKTIQRLTLGLNDPGRHVMTPGFDPAHLQFTAAESPEITVRDRHRLIRTRGQKGQPGINAVQRDHHVRAPGDLIQHRLKIRNGTAALLPQPQGVHEHVQHLKAHFLRHLFGQQQSFPSATGHRLVGLDPSETGIFVPEKTETHHQQPLQRGSPGCVAFCEGHILIRVLQQLLLDLHAFLIKRLQRQWNDPQFFLSRLQTIRERNLRRNVPVNDDGRIHGNEVNFSDIRVKARLRLVDHPTPVKTDQFQTVFHTLRLLFLLRHQHIMLHRCDHLHRGNPRARGDPCRVFDGHGRDPGHLQRPVKTIVPPHHGILPVDVTAPEQMSLLRTVNDLTVGEIGSLLFPQDLLFSIPVEAQRDPGSFLHFQQLRDQPVISPVGQQNIRIVLIHQFIQPVDHCRGIVKQKPLLFSVYTNFKPGRLRF